MFMDVFVFMRFVYVFCLYNSCSIYGSFRRRWRGPLIQRNAPKMNRLEEAEVTKILAKTTEQTFGSVNGTVVSSETCATRIASTATATAS